MTSRPLPRQADLVGVRAEPAPSFWASTRLVAAREFVQRGRDKSFYLSTALMVLILVGLVVLPRLFGDGGARPSYDVAFLGPDAVAVQNAAQVRGRDLQLDVNPVQVDAAQVRAQVEDGTLDAAVDGDRLVVAEQVDGQLGLVLQDAATQVQATANLRAAGLDPGAVARARDVPPLRVDALDPPDDALAARQSVASLGTFLLYFQLIGYGFWVALGVVEEKSSRVVEVILAAVPTRALLAGKVIGVGLLGLLQLLFLTAVGLVAAVSVDAIPIDAGVLWVVALVLAWFVLGYAFYACFFAAAAARVTSQEDLQNVTTPATLVLLASFVASFYVGNNPDAPVSKVLALVPPFSALVNPARVVSGEAPAWQIVVAVGLMLMATAGLIVVAARLYDGAILRMGGRVSVREAWRGGRREPAPADRR